MTGCDAVVVGGGIVGASVAWGMARLGGAGVVLCEQGRPPGPGATARSGALLRQHHTARCDIDLAVAGCWTFQHWAEEVGGDCGYRGCGFAMIVAPEHSDRLWKNVAAVNEAGGNSSVITAAELEQRHAALHVPAQTAVAYEPGGGYVDPVQATVSLLSSATKAGVTISHGVRVTAIVCRNGRAAGVETNLGTISADTVVVCAGATATALLDPIGVHLPLQARRIGLARADTALAPGTLPAAIDDTLGTYFRPADHGGVYFGVAVDPAAGDVVDPALVHGAEATAAARHLAERIPALSTPLLTATLAGVDAYTPDRRPVIGWTSHPGIYICSGFSGGGVKVAPAVGSLVAAELLHGARPPKLERYSPRRFCRGELIKSDHPYDHL